MFSVKHSVVAALLSYFAQSAYTSPVDQSTSTPDSQISPINDTTAGNLTVQSGCYQGDCPDFDASFDLLTSQGLYYAHFLRYNHRTDYCNECHQWEVNGGGCKDFTICGHDFSMCVDIGMMRAHRYLDGKKDCFLLEQNDLGYCYCQNVACRPFVLTPKAKVACTW
ncbi:hypothetical protein CONLIGDRAFT_630845 [Coniochaeta ligniaria NRRL 30616]|uniref:Cyanovirin-N domain-containing protein n=1 Tax=Coniochaeta ligniaria NRRL 30616 TaxID=1408157 RepID=A0A1J7IUD5_9PEZI|nr:hypothetical protein CONLIGDRAFT_630845 [Coniochaeta ligniaria NRRL 30616]